MKDRSNRELQLGDHVAYYRVTDGQPSGHVGTVVQLDAMRGSVVFRLDPSSKPAASSGCRDFRTKHPEHCLVIDRPAVSEAAPATAKHMMGLDPESVDWAAHHVFCASL
jgi:hypothetical protein